MDSRDYYLLRFAYFCLGLAMRNVENEYELSISDLMAYDMGFGPKWISAASPHWVVIECCERLSQWCSSLWFLRNSTCQVKLFLKGNEERWCGFKIFFEYFNQSYSIIKAISIQLLICWFLKIICLSLLMPFQSPLKSKYATLVQRNQKKN